MSLWSKTRTAVSTGYGSIGNALLLRNLTAIHPEYLMRPPYALNPSDLKARLDGRGWIDDFKNASERLRHVHAIHPDYLPGSTGFKQREKMKKMRNGGNAIESILNPHSKLTAPRLNAPLRLRQNKAGKKTCGGGKVADFFRRLFRKGKKKAKEVANTTVTKAKEVVSDPKKLQQLIENANDLVGPGISEVRKAVKNKTPVKDSVKNVFQTLSTPEQKKKYVEWVRTNNPGAYDKAKQVYDVGKAVMNMGKRRKPLDADLPVDFPLNAEPALF